MESMGSPVAIHTQGYCQVVTRTVAESMARADVVGFGDRGLALPQERTQNTVKFLDLAKIPTSLLVSAHCMPLSSEWEPLAESD